MNVCVCVRIQTRVHRNGVTSGHELFQCRCKELNSGRLQEQYMLLSSGAISPDLKGLLLRKGTSNYIKHQLQLCKTMKTGIKDIRT